MGRVASTAKFVRWVAELEARVKLAELLPKVIEAIEWHKRDYAFGDRSTQLADMAGARLLVSVRIRRAYVRACRRSTAGSALQRQLPSRLQQCTTASQRKVAVRRPLPLISGDVFASQ